MQVVILAGGFGTRITEESHFRPKPMIEIGDMPILWHIMKIYSHYGFNEFIICIGYKGHMIKDFFCDYFLHTSDITFDFRSPVNSEMTVHNSTTEPWKVTLVDTGINTQTGGRVKCVEPYITDDSFMLTYGDGVADVDIGQLAQYHKKHGKIATVTAVQPAGRFGAIDISVDNGIRRFHEKPKGDGSWINGGFFVLNREIFKYITGTSTVFEQEPLETLAADCQLVAYKHEGFWQPMDIMKDKLYLETLWDTKKAPWRIWN